MIRKYDFMTAKNGHTSKWTHKKLTLKKVIAYLEDAVELDLTYEEYHDMNHAEQAKVKSDCRAFLGGYFEGKRSIQTIESRSIIALDIDTKFDGDLPKYLENNSPYSFYIYNTMTATKRLQKYRVLFFLDFDIKAAFYEPLARRIARDLRIIDYVDRTCYRKNQLMYAPTWLDGATCTLSKYVECGEKLVDTEDIIESFSDIYDQKTWDAAKDEGVIGATAEMQLADPRLKDGLVGQFCSFVGNIANAIEMFGLPYEHEEGDRWTYTRGESANGFVIYDDEQHAYSNHESDPAGQDGHSLNAFDLVRIHLYGDRDTKEQYADPTRAPSYKALVEHLATLPEFKEVQASAIAAKAQAALQAQIEASDVFDEFVEEEVEEEPKRAKKGKKSAKKSKRKAKTITVRGKAIPWDVVTDEAVAAKVSEFMLSDPNTLQRTDKGTPKSTSENLAAIVQHCPIFKGRILFDEFARGVIYVGRKAWGGSETWQDRDTIELRLWCEAWGMTFSKGEVEDIVLTVAQRNTVNTLADFFKYNLPEWDGTPRIATMFADCLGAENTEVNAMIAEKTLLSGLERAVNTGRSKVQAMTVLQGAQGIKKSTFWEKLCPRAEWFTDSKINIGHKDGYSILAGSFIIELGELASLKRADRDEIKNFISADSDKYRPSYARHDEVFNRHNIFAGSVNDDDFLSDPTGNRRFKVVPCHGGVDLYDVMTEDYVLQLWAEAAQLRADGTKHWYDEKEEALTEEIASTFVRRGALDEIVEAAALSKKPEEWETAIGGEALFTILNGILKGVYAEDELTVEPAEFITAADIADMLDIQLSEHKRYITQIGLALNKLPQLKKVQRQVNGVRRRGYEIIK